MLAHPFAEDAGLERILEDEDRGALHRLFDDRRFRAAAFGQHPHAAVVAGDQRSFGRRHRHVEIAPRMLAVDAQRTSEPDRHLRGADEVLDVPGQDGRVEGVAADMVELGAGLGFDEGAAFGCRLGRIIVGAVPRNMRPRACRTRHRRRLPRRRPVSAGAPRGRALYEVGTRRDRPIAAGPSPATDPGPATGPSPGERGLPACSIRIIYIMEPREQGIIFPVDCPLDVGCISPRIGTST